MLVAARAHDAVATAARGAVLLGERGLGGKHADLSTRLRRWAESRDPRAASAARLASRWQGLVEPEGGSTPVEDDAGLCVALAFPDRVARRRGADGAEWLTVGGQSGSASCRERVCQ